MKSYVALVGTQENRHNAEVWTVKAKTLKGARRLILKAAGAYVKAIKKVGAEPARHWSVD